MFKRSITPIIARLAQIYPIIGITGPRQSGKTTLAKTMFPNLPYVLLEDLDTRLLAQNDPRAFLRKYQQGAIFDEVQHVPELLSYLQGIVDESPVMGRYIITGSQNFALSTQIAQSLAGRVGMVTLLPLSLAELNSKNTVNAQEPQSLANIFTGGYPSLHARGMQPHEFFPSYLQTYVERDVRQIKKIENLGTFRTFIKLCAGRIGQVVNFSSLAQDAGISHTTARDWLAILEASYILFSLQPYYNNFTRRLVKSPKIYFYDTGLACSLLGIEQENQLETHYLKGGLYENLVILELLKGRLNRALPAHLYFWRDLTGHEVDAIGEWGGNLHAFEIKAGETFNAKMVKEVKYFCELVPTSKGYLIYDGAQDGIFAGIELIPLSTIEKLFE